MSDRERRRPWDWVSVRAAGATYGRAWRQTLSTGNTEHKLGLAATAVALLVVLALLVRRTKRGQGDGGANDVAARGADVPAPAGPADPRAPTATTQEATHTVEPGDTLGDIAQRYGTTVAALVEANGLADPNLLQRGQQITVPSP